MKKIFTIIAFAILSITSYAQKEAPIANFEVDHVINGKRNDEGSITWDKHPTKLENPITINTNFQKNVITMYIKNADSVFKIYLKNRIKSNYERSVDFESIDSADDECLVRFEGREVPIIYVFYDDYAIAFIIKD